MSSTKKNSLIDETKMIKGKTKRVKITQNVTPSETRSDMDEIDELFRSKKEIIKKRKIDLIEEDKGAQRRSNAEGEKKKPSDAKRIVLDYNREDLSKIKTGEWASDGLGGVFDTDGWTGRTESGMKIYKHHLFNKKNAGRTKDCPFDCDCCYI